MTDPPQALVQWLVDLLGGAVALTPAAGSTGAVQTWRVVAAGRIYYCRDGLSSRKFDQELRVAEAVWPTLGGCPERLGADRAGGRLLMSACAGNPSPQDPAAWRAAGAAGGPIARLAPGGCGPPVAGSGPGRTGRCRLAVAAEGGARAGGGGGSAAGCGGGAGSAAETLVPPRPAARELAVGRRYFVPGGLGARPPRPAGAGPGSARDCGRGPIVCLL